MMEDRYVKQNIGDTEAYVPDILNNKGHLNCSPFCKDINNKVLTKLNVLENKTSSTDYRNIGLIYYTFSEEKVSKLSNETIIQLSGDNENRIIQPYGIAIVNKPEQISDDGSNMFSAIKTMQKLDCKVLNFEYQTLN
ncbi:hypothetical protein KPH14_000851 [Odynerus spinipes]|uniref:Uncharacterized protein n=1 Tax=Odynerus spinipes TaxID=1348599 RepID=A0AAD9RDE2_9HYME|nr:hypothetical protein KPH14_000851 [Odynerus spinipes]